MHNTLTQQISLIQRYKNSFLPTVLLPTRITDHSATLIDHIYLYEKQFHGNYVSGNLFTDTSDHLANLKIFKQNTKHLIKRPSIRIFGEKNKNKFGNILADINWEAVLQNKNANAAMDTFYQHLLATYNKPFPFVKLLPKRAKDKPWITSALKSSIK